jgi:hypothetical protein
MSRVLQTTSADDTAISLTGAHASAACFSSLVFSVQRLQVAIVPNLHEAPSSDARIAHEIARL